MITPDQQQALIAKLTAVADDQLILAHRNAEWTGHAPILEEDIALANLAQDELGHATLLYELLEPLTGRTPDQMAFLRDAPDWRHAPLLELPKGDWAFTMLRQFFYDAYELVLYNALGESTYEPLAHTAVKIRREEIYHLHHSHIWVERLGLGTDESHRRLQNALDEQWPHLPALFAPLPDEQLLHQAGIVPDPAALRVAWEEQVLPHLAHCQLTLPPTEDEAPTPFDRTHHTPHLARLLADMQMVARSEPEAVW